MRKEYRCKRCGHLLGIEKDGKLQILCVHRGEATGGKKCGNLNEISLSLRCDRCNDKNTIS